MTRISAIFVAFALLSVCPCLVSCSKRPNASNVHDSAKLNRLFSRLATRPNPDTSRSLIHPKSNSTTNDSHRGYRMQGLSRLATAYGMATNVIHRILDMTGVTQFVLTKFCTIELRMPQIVKAQNDVHMPCTANSSEHSPDSADELIKDNHGANREDGSRSAPRNHEISTVRNPASILALSEDVMHKYIFERLDIVSLFTLLSLCKPWNEVLAPRIMAYDATLHEAYLQALLHPDSRGNCESRSMSSYLPDEKLISRYFGWFLINGTFGEAELEQKPFRRWGKKYLENMTSGEIDPPKIRDRTLLCKYYVELFKWAHRICAGGLTFDRPKFFTDTEYGQAIRQLAYEDGFTLKLPESLIVSNMPELFNIIEQDEELMKKLILAHFEDFGRPSIILILDGWSSAVKAFAPLIFSQTELFRPLAGKDWESKNYLDFMAKPDVFRKIAAKYYSIPEFTRLLVNVLLHFEGNYNAITTIMKSIDLRRSAQDPLIHEYIRKKLNSELPIYLSAVCRSADTRKFVNDIMEEYNYGSMNKMA